MDHIHPTPTHRVLFCLAEVVQPTLAEEIGCAVRQGSPHVRRHYINEGPKLPLASPECFLCSFPIINVHREAVPLNDLAVGIAQRFTHRMMPPVLSICASPAVYYVEQSSGFERTGECLPCLHLVIGVNDLHPPPIKELLEGNPKIVKKSLREMTWLSVRPQ